MEAFGSCRLCLVEIEGATGRRPPARRRSRRAWRADPDAALGDIRRGVMELYISDHPLDCLTCAANGDCELQDMAGAVGCATCATAMTAPITSSPKQRLCQLDWLPKDESNPYFTYDPVEMHRLLALRARLRGGAGHVRVDHRRPRLRQPQWRPGMGEAFSDVRMRLLRRLRAGLPDGDAQREDGHRDRPARAFGRHHLRLLRRRLLVQGRDARRGSRAHGALQGRQGESRPFLRQGPLRLWLCDTIATASSSR